MTPPDAAPTADPGLELMFDAATRTLRAGGVLDIATVDRLTEAAESFCADPARWVLDLAALAIIDAAGLGAVVQLCNRRHEADADLFHIEVNPWVAHVFQLGGLAPLI